MGDRRWSIARSFVALGAACVVLAMAVIGCMVWRASGRAAARYPAGMDGSPRTIEQQAEAMHQLEAGEVARLVPTRLPSRASSMWEGCVHLWDGQVFFRSHLSEGVTIGHLVRTCVSGYWPRDVAESLTLATMQGDWVVRYGATTREKMEAIEGVLEGRLARRIRFWKEPAAQGGADVIVIRGQLLEPPTGVIDLYSDQRDPGASREESGTAVALGRVLSGVSGLNVEIDPPLRASSARLRWRRHEDSWVQEDPARLDRLLKNIAEQAGLTLTRQKRVVEIFRVAPER